MKPTTELLLAKTITVSLPNICEWCWGWYQTRLHAYPPVLCTLAGAYSLFKANGEGSDWPIDDLNLAATSSMPNSLRSIAATC